VSGGVSPLGELGYFMAITVRSALRRRPDFVDARTYRHGVEALVVIDAFLNPLPQRGLMSRFAVVVFSRSHHQEDGPARVIFPNRRDVAG
jgi:hypothetical protein